MPADAKIKDDLSRFELEGPALEDALNISNVLSAGPESPEVTKGLGLLDERLAKQSKELPKRAMGTVLLTSEAQWGVNVDSSNAVRVTALAFLPPDTFGKQLASATLIKDPGAGINHGEYTHRIQWFILHECKVATNPNALLRLTGSTKAMPEKDSLNGLWDCLFDRLRFAQYGMKAFIATGTTDFRSPEHFNLWLIDQTERFPALAKYLRDRCIKRLPQSNTDALEKLESWCNTHPQSDSADYLKKRLKRQEFDEPIAVLYALKKGGVTDASAASEQQMAIAIKLVAGGLLVRK